MQIAIVPAGQDASAAGLSLALTLATRLCHDLAGTAGALQGALDMVAEGEGADALPLAQDCARELVARLRLLRAAFGDADTREAFGRLAAGLPGADRLIVDVSALPDSLDEGRGRLAANLLLLGAQALPRGGAIRLSADSGCLTLEVVGQRAAWPPALARGLVEPACLAEAAGDARNVGIAVLLLLAGAAGLRITVESETRLRLC